MKTAGFLITGNEVLSAKTKDTNGPFMGMHLRRIGVSVKASMMCSDLKTDLNDCLNYLAERCDVILMTGGLGPTSDDLTAEVVAEFFNIPVQFNQEAWEACAAFFIKAGRDSIPESNKKQALLPQGCELLPNKLGTAAGFCTTGKKFGKTLKIYSLPGVPYEMEPMFLEYVLPNLTDPESMPVVKNWQVFIMGESFMQTAIEKAEKALIAKYPNAVVSYQAHPYYVSYGITLFPRSVIEKMECENYLYVVYSAEVENAFAKHILYAEDKKVPHYILDRLEYLKLSIAFAESSCAGYLSKEFSSLNKSSQYFLGSIVTNNKDIRNNLLFNSEDNKMKSTEDLVVAMSLSTLQKFNSDITLSEFKNKEEMCTNTNLDIKEGFYLAMAFKKKSLENIEKIKDLLAKFSWIKNENVNKQDIYVFSCFIKSNQRHTPDVQKTRAVHYLLCSLSAVL
ncbi:molybdopterin-binding protein [Fluviispira sanaruensis]|uniref:Competence/damage-inducible protein A n=1 Tax=Fluviispira sanaruensis TaxID=2493639 RepID=A0A4P2VUH9_FLUSA|nr:molybdopterin-binding protein [Fluviispira sanaruensis]BBH52522.1 competence/damage-inducible protein A [Fluviispira sanaruensis]